MFFYSQVFFNLLMMSFPRQEVSSKTHTVIQTNASLFSYEKKNSVLYLYIDIQMKSVVLDVFFLKKKYFS